MAGNWRKPAAPFRVARSWRNIRRYSELKPRVAQLRGEADVARKRLSRAREAYRRAVRRGANVAFWQRKVQRNINLRNQRMNAWGEARRELDELLRSIQELNTVLLIGERDYWALRRLEDEEGFNGTIQLASTVKGRQVSRMLREEGTEFEILKEV